MTKDNRWAMLCRLKVAAFDDEDWLWERKHDGFRLRARITEEDIRLTARSGADKTAIFPDIVQALAFTVDWGRCPMTLDGEVINANGLGFQDGIQPRVNRELELEDAVKRLPAKLVAFDMLEGWGEDLQGHPLRSRLNMLHNSRPSGALAPESSRTGTALWMTAEANGWEGIVGKRLDEPYMPHRRNWVKVKLWKYGTFRVVAVLPGMGKRQDLVGAFVLEDMDGRLVGECGNFKGMTYAKLADLTTSLMKTRQHETAWPKGAYGVRPFNIRVKFQEYTNDRQLRFPVYLPPDSCQESPDKNLGTPEP